MVNLEESTSDREYRAYLKCAPRDNSIERSPTGLWDYSEHMVYDVTAKGLVDLKLHMKLEKQDILVHNNTFYATEEDFPK